MNILHVDSSITGETSTSRKLSQAIVAQLMLSNPATQLVRRDLIAAPMTMFGQQAVAKRGSQPETGQDSPLEVQFVDELLAADVVVIGAPMYNFGVPAQLKTWIDYLAIPGKTFSYTAKGPVGLLGGKRAIIASSRGNFYSAGTPGAAFDYQESFLRTVMGFFGITDVEIVRAEGLAISSDHAVKAMDAAMAQIAALRPATAT